MSKTSLFVTALLAAAAGLPSVAAAAPLDTPRPVAARAVSIADLDLSSAAGRARLDRRIAAAVRSVCGKASPTNLRALRDVRDCREETLAAVLADRRLGEVYVAEIATGAGASDGR